MFAIGDTVYRTEGYRKWDDKAHRKSRTVSYITYIGEVVEIGSDAKGRERLRIKWRHSKPRTWNLATAVKLFKNAAEKAEAIVAHDAREAAHAALYYGR
jgi:hypothetical protein